jgi:capsular polysaccharide biosynthesis protein
MLRQAKNDKIEKTNTTDNDQIDLIELLFEILHHWKLILLTTILVAGVSYVYSEKTTTPMYQSTSKLYVVSKTISASSISAALSLGSNLTDDYLVVLKGRPIIDQVIKNLGLNTSYGGLAGRISLNNPDGSRIIEITVKDTSAQRAKQIADEMAVVSAAYISEKMDQDPPSILQYGYADGGQINNTIRSDTRRGALIGACLAIAFVVIMYLLNDTIMCREDVEKRLGLTLLGTLPLENNVEFKEAKKQRKRNRKKAS